MFKSIYINNETIYIFIMKYYIYKILHLERPEWFYIGSTNNFSRRKSSHKKAHKNKVNKKEKVVFAVINIKIVKVFFFFFGIIIYPSSPS